MTMRMNEDRWMMLTLREIQWDQATIEGGAEGALVGSWFDWSHRMFKEASAEKSRMELRERAPLLLVLSTPTGNQRQQLKVEEADAAV
eukprot:6490388-Amphidinium_carterae.1